jgi:hypothetical protein
MKQKELLVRIGIAAFTFLIAYLLTSFVTLSFNITKWSEDARLITVLCGFGLGFAIATYPGYKFEDE